MVMKNPTPWKKYPTNNTPTARDSAGSKTRRTFDAMTPTSIYV